MSDANEVARVAADASAHPWTAMVAGAAIKISLNPLFQAVAVAAAVGLAGAVYALPKLSGDLTDLKDAVRELRKSVDSMQLQMSVDHYRIDALEKAPKDKK